MCFLSSRASSVYLIPEYFAYRLHLSGSDFDQCQSFVQVLFSLFALTYINELRYDIPDMAIVHLCKHFHFLQCLMTILQQSQCRSVCGPVMALVLEDIG